MLSFAIIKQHSDRTDTGTVKRPLDESQDKEDLLNALGQAEGNKSESARILGVSRVIVWKMMKKCRLNPGSEGINK